MHNQCKHVSHTPPSNCTQPLKLKLWRGMPHTQCKCETVATTATTAIESIDNNECIMLPTATNCHHCYHCNWNTGQTATTATNCNAFTILSVLMCSHTPCVLSPLGSLHYTCNTQTQATTTVNPQPSLQNNDCNPHLLNRKTNAICVTDGKLSGMCDAIASLQNTNSLYNIKQSTHWARFWWNATQQTIVIPCTGND